MLSQQHAQQHQTPGQPQHQQHIHQPMQVQSNMMWPINLQQQQHQINPNPAPVLSFSSIDETTKVIAAKMAPALGELRTVTSQGMLLPLVAMPTTDSKSEENPKVQMQECMNVIEEALQDPALADAGKVLLKAMTASSSYMSDILESKKQHEQQQQQQLQKQLQVQKQLQLQKDQQLHQKQAAPQSGTDMVFFLGSSMHARQAPFSNPIKEPCAAFSGAVLQKPALNVPVPPLMSPLLTPTPVTPVLSATPHPQQVQRTTSRTTVSRAAPLAQQVKPTVHKASCGRVEKTSVHKHQHHQASRPNINPELTRFEGSPHKFLLAILRARDYPTLRLTSYEAGYHSNPTHLQLASFGTAVVKAVHSSDAQSLSKLIGCGLSPNPCNQFGDSILSLICKRADYSVFSVLVDQGCDLQICDSFGRTALHNLAWASQFSGPMAKVILDTDLHQLLLEDKRGQCPLEYVRQDKWGEWISFLRANMDEYWPVSRDRPIKPLPRDFRNGPVADPMQALPTDYAVKISSGEISPEDAVKQSQPPTPTPGFSLF